MKKVIESINNIQNSDLSSEEKVSALVSLQNSCNFYGLRKISLESLISQAIEEETVVA
jgi:hypothetical protein